MATPTTSGPTHSYTPSGTSHIDALLHSSLGYKWGTGGAGSGATITYSLPGSQSWWSTATQNDGGYGPSSGDGEPWWDFAPLGASERAAFEAALDAWSEVANITFVKLVDNESTVGDIRVAYSGAVEADDDAVAWGYYPRPAASAGDIWLDPGHAENYTQTPGSFGFHVLLHEIGHALGLDHSFEGAAKLSGAEDSDQYTVMSYTESPLYTIWSSEPLLYDIAAIQYLYGANTSTRTGNDVYSYSSGAEIRDTIWDAGGTDEIDASNQSLGVTIDLREGSFSSIGVKDSGGAATKNVAIAYDVDIENATGGSGGDVITGNALDNLLVGNDGNDRIKGTRGEDTLIGGSGNDKLVGGGDDDLLIGDLGVDKLKGGGGSDLFDFNSLAEQGDKIKKFAATAGGDVLDLSDLLVGYDDGDPVTDYLALEQKGKRTILQVDADGGGDSFEDFLTFQKLTGLDLDTLLANGNFELLG